LVSTEPAAAHCVQNSDSTETCVTGDQLKSVLAGSAAAGAPVIGGAAPSGSSALGAQTDATTTTTSANDNEPPVIHINGNNPAEVNVGDTYADLGATITSPTADLNLGIHLYVDGVAVDAVQLDTSTAATHSVDYVATDPAGLTATSTRTVIVSAAANDNAASSTPVAANDNPPPIDATGTATTTP
jgi:hypothetical protein